MPELQYKRKNELKRDILDEVGVEYGERFQNSAKYGIRKPHLMLIVAEIKPSDESYNFTELTMYQLYNKCREWLDLDERTGSGDWQMERDLLKAIHREVCGDEIDERVVERAT